MMTKRKKKGMVSTRARGKTKVRTMRTSVAMLPVSSDGTATSQRRPREAVAPDAPEVDGHEQARDQRDEDAVEDVEAEQRVRADLAAAEEEGARVVDVVEPRDELVAGALVPQAGRGAASRSRSGRRGTCAARRRSPCRAPPSGACSA